MPLVHYLAYGSNLHPVRLIERVPSARLLGPVELPGYRVTFHKRSTDQSGKCNLSEDAESIAHGALYEFDHVDLAVLNQAEGLGKGYLGQQMQVTLNAVVFIPLVYIAASTHVDSQLSPYDWYHQMVLCGARYLRFPETYIARLEEVQVLPDPDRRRSGSNWELVRRLQQDDRQAFPVPKDETRSRAE